MCDVEKVMDDIFFDIWYDSADQLDNEELRKIENIIYDNINSLNIIMQNFYFREFYDI